MNAKLMKGFQKNDILHVVDPGWKNMFLKKFKIKICDIRWKITSFIVYKLMLCCCFFAIATTVF